MRQFFRMLLLALVLMTVALISALTAMQLAIHRREVTIPKLVGMSPVASKGPARHNFMTRSRRRKQVRRAMLALQHTVLKMGTIALRPRGTPPAEPQTAPVTSSAISEPGAASMIVTQTPAPGQKIVVGSAVNFEVR